MSRRLLPPLGVWFLLAVLVLPAEAIPQPQTAPAAQRRTPTMAPAARPNAGPLTSIIDLGTLGGPVTVARAINDSGMVTGYSELPNGRDRAFRWTATGGMQDLGAPNGATALDGLDINAAGDIVGSLVRRVADNPFEPHTVEGLVRGRPFRASPATGIQEIFGGADGNLAAAARGINMGGTIVGHRSFIPVTPRPTPTVGANALVATPGPAGVASTELNPAYRWTANGGVEILPGLGGSSSYGTAINDQGVVAGDSFGRAVRWTPSGSIQDISPPGAIASGAYGINNLGQIVGYFSAPNLQAFRWTPPDLPPGSPAPGFALLGDGWAYAINDDGDMVGFTGGAPRALIWDASGNRAFLDTLLPPGSGWTLTRAHDINNRGQIVGEGIHNGQSRGFLLNAFDLQAYGMEVTQAIQDLDNTVPLIAGKRTIVRFYVTGTQTKKGVTARLEGKRGGVSLGTPLAPMNNPAATIDVKPLPDRGNLDDSFWFELPSNWISGGEITLQAEVNPVRSPSDATHPIEEADYTNNLTDPLAVTFRLVAPVRLRIIKYQEQVIVGGSYRSPRDLDVQMLASYLRRLYPAPIDVITAEFQTDSGFLYAEPIVLEMTRIRNGGDPGRIWYMMMPDQSLGSVFRRGYTSGIPSFNSSGPTGVVDATNPYCNAYGCWDTDGSYGDWYGAHEIGHALDRLHTGHCGAFILPLIHEAYPYPGGKIGGPEGDEKRYYGLDVGDKQLGLPMKIINPSATDAMSYCANEWISDFTYRRIYDYVRTLPVTSQAARNVTGDFLQVQGIVAAASTNATFLTVTRRSEVGEVPALVPGPFRIRQLAANGAMLADQAVTSQPDSEGGQVIAQVVSFMPGTRRVAIFSDVAGQEIGSAAISLNAPVVTITGRTGGATPSGPITVSWNATDADGDPLSYAVAYRPGPTSFWRPLGTTTATSLTVNTSQLEGTGGAATGVLQVTANDGVLAGMAESAPFIIGNKAPVVTISSPLNGSTFAVGQPIPLVGSAQDVEDGTIPDAQLRWSSAGGDLGTGGLLFLSNLAAGQHSITLRATDSSQQQGQATVTINVASGPLGPILSTRPDALEIPYTIGGPAPAGQVVAISNPGGGTLAWSATASAPWLTLSATSGPGPANLTIGVNPSALPAGYLHTGLVTISSPGASGSPKLINVVAQAANPPTFTPTASATATPLVTSTRTTTRSATATNTSAASPTRTATPTLPVTPTRTPTVGSTVGGSGFTLQAGSPVRLSWNAGTGQGTYLVARWSPEHGLVFLPPTTGSLPPTATSLLDDAVLVDEAYCYILFALGPGFPGVIDLKRISDMACLYPDTSYPTVPGQFSVRLDEGPIARLRWTPPGGQTDYELTAFTFDSTPGATVTLPGTAVDYAYDTHSVSTCFYLDAFAGDASVGGTDVICAVPNIAVTVTSPTALSDALDRVVAAARSARTAR